MFSHKYNLKKKLIKKYENLSYADKNMKENKEAKFILLFQIK
jgi:hypothetical protein